MYTLGLPVFFLGLLKTLGLQAGAHLQRQNLHHGRFGCGVG
jgi:hypothetical protein